MHARRILGLNGHMIVQSITRGVSDYDAVAGRVAAVPGVTSVTRVLDAPALTYWKMNQVAQAAIAGLAGCFYPGFVGTLVPEAFNIVESFTMLAMVIVAAAALVWLVNLWLTRRTSSELSNTST